MYSINDFEIGLIEQDAYVVHDTKAAKISNVGIRSILQDLKSRANHELSDEHLQVLALAHQVDVSALKKLLIEKLDILRPLSDRKFEHIYINCDDALISELLCEALAKYYKITPVSKDRLDFSAHSLVLFYRANYTSLDYAALHQSLDKHVYVITAGLIGNLLVIDNIYFKGSGLATHTSNLHQLFHFLESGLEATKDNWLLFYRTLLKSNIRTFPTPNINACEKGFAAYCLYKFVAQFTDFWSAPLTTDQLNWFWHVDLKKSKISKEVAIHSPFSEFDMNLNMANLKKQVELAD